MPVKPCPPYPISINPNKLENVVRGTPMFPCGAYLASVGDNVTQCIPWHWHNEIEVLTVCEGTLKLDFVGYSHIIKKDEGAFINSGVLQSFTGMNNDICIIKSFVFHPDIISGAIESSFEQRYVRPLMRCAKLPSIHFREDVKWHKQAVRLILDAFNDYQSESFGYEFLVREKLSRLWLLIVNNYREELDSQTTGNIDSLRLKDMLSFIHDNFANRVELRDIAKSAAISERECLRCFKRTIRISPMQYLMRYRISVAAEMLVSSNMSIAEICGRTGFDSPSYFTQTFKKLIGANPRDYRNSFNSS